MQLHTRSETQKLGTQKKLGPGSASNFDTAAQGQEACIMNIEKTGKGGGMRINGNKIRR